MRKVSASGRLSVVNFIWSLKLQLFAKTLATALVEKQKLRDHEK